MASKYKIVNCRSWSACGYRFIEWQKHTRNGEVFAHSCIYQHDTLGFVSVWSDIRYASARACFGGRVFSVSCRPGSATQSGTTAIVSRILIQAMEREFEAWQAKA